MNHNKVETTIQLPFFGKPRNELDELIILIPVIITVILMVTTNSVLGDIIFNSVCSHEVTINFLQFCKALVALSMKLYPRSDASLSFALFLSEILYALPFVPVNTRARAHARAAARVHEGHRQPLRVLWGKGRDVRGQRIEGSGGIPPGTAAQRARSVRPG